MELIIPERYLLRWEQYTKFSGNHRMDYYAARYVFSVPDAANLEDGYTIYIDTADTHYENRKLVCCGGRREHYNGAYHLTVPEYTNGFVYTATKTENREEGKKYKRYKFSPSELQALYNGQNLSDAVCAVARVKFYANNGRRTAKEVVREDYIVGERIGCWFYSDELDNKRRVGTKGLNILGEIKKEHKEEIRQLIKDYKAQNKASEEADDKLRYNLWLAKTMCEEINRMYVLNDKVEKAKEMLCALKMDFAALVESGRKALEDNEEEFLKKLKSIFRQNI